MADITLTAGTASRFIVEIRYTFLPSPLSYVFPRKNNAKRKAYERRRRERKKVPLEKFYSRVIARESEERDVYFGSTIFLNAFAKSLAESHEKDSFYLANRQCS